MPFETYVIEPGDDIHERPRTHKAVAEDITATFEDIAKRGGKFVTSLSVADKTANTSYGGHPDGAAYIVAEFPEPSAQ